MYKYIELYSQSMKCDRVRKATDDDDDDYDDMMMMIKVIRDVICCENDFYEPNVGRGFQINIGVVQRRNTSKMKIR